jgi:hypothetical protein
MSFFVDIALCRTPSDGYASLAESLKKFENTPRFPERIHTDEERKR